MPPVVDSEKKMCPRAFPGLSAVLSPATEACTHLPARWHSAQPDPDHPAAPAAARCRHLSGAVCSTLRTLLPCAATSTAFIPSFVWWNGSAPAASSSAARLSLFCRAA